MKKTIILLGICFLFSGCTAPENKIQIDNVPPPVASQSDNNPANSALANTGWQTFQNPELGISFQYPASLGQAQEFKDGNGKFDLFRLQRQNYLPADFEFFPAGIDKIRDCKDVLANGFPGKVISIPTKCEIIFVDNAPFQVLEYQDPNLDPPYTVDFTQVIDLETKNGIWSFLSKNKSLFNDVLNVAKSVKHLK